jgi:hypothetical protein
MRLTQLFSLPKNETDLASGYVRHVVLNLDISRQEAIASSRFRTKNKRFQPTVEEVPECEPLLQGLSDEGPVLVEIPVEPSADFAAQIPIAAEPDTRPQYISIVIIEESSRIGAAPSSQEPECASPRRAKTRPIYIRLQYGPDEPTNGPYVRRKTLWKPDEDTPKVSSSKTQGCQTSRSHCDSNSNTSFVHLGSGKTWSVGRDEHYDIVMQPETRPITQEQLVAEVKGIYAGLVMVEAKCIEVDNKQTTLASADPGTQSKLNNEQ